MIMSRDTSYDLILSEASVHSCDHSVSSVLSLLCVHTQRIIVIGGQRSRIAHLFGLYTLNSLTLL